MSSSTAPMRIYLDHAATTPPSRAAVAAMQQALEECWGNPSSIHADGQHARMILDGARDTLAAFTGTGARNVVFTASGTEADNLALTGILGRWGSSRGQHIVVSSIEHEAVLSTAEALADSGAAEVTMVHPDHDGVIQPSAVAQALRPDTVLVSIMYVNNETGVIQDIPAIARTVHAARAETFVHTDAVQGAGYLPCDMESLGVDLLSLSSHKLYGPKGAGCLVLRDGVFVAPVIHGGGQERNRRSGTEAIPAIAGFAAAVRELVEHRSAWCMEMESLRTMLTSEVRKELPGTIIPGERAQRVPSCASFVFPGIRNELLLTRLDAAGISASGGSACSAGTTLPSHVLTAMGFSDEDARGLLRCTLGHATTREDARAAAAAIVDAVRALSTSIADA